MAKNRVDLLRSVGIFARVSEEDLRQIAGLLGELEVGNGAVLARQGEKADCLFIVLAGRVRGFAVDAEGRETVQALLTEGQAFGEMALLAGAPSPLTMQAVTDVRLLTLAKEEFDRFLAHNVPVALEMVKVMAERQPVASSTVVTEQAPAEDTPSGNVFTLFSPKGGVGKSTIAVNLAVCLARLHRDSVVLVDLSLTFGHDMLLLNLSPRSSLAATSAEALSRMGLDDWLAHYLALHPSSGLRVVAGSTRPEEGEMVSGETARVAIDRLRHHFEYVVIDTGTQFTDPVLAALDASDRALIVCSPEIAVLRDVRECQRVLNDIVRLPRDRILYIMNHIFPFKALTKDQFENALQQKLFAELPYGGDVPAKAALRGEAFVEMQPSSAIAKAIRSLAMRLGAEKTRVTVSGSRRDEKRAFLG